MERPDAQVQVIDLVDTGVGADTDKMDGIYSRYFLGVNVVGRYTLRCVVSNTSSTSVNNGQHTAVNSLNRIQSGGAFRVLIILSISIILEKKSFF